VTGLTAPGTTLPGVGLEPVAAPVVKTALARDLVMGETGDDVRALQTRLTALGFAPGVADGIFGDQTQQAVWAFEKLVSRTPRAQATGRVSNDTWQRMQDPIVVQPRRAGPGTHVEIYLPEQVAAVFTDDRATLVIHISSGTGKEWCEDVLLDTDAKGNKLDPPVPDRLCGVSKTPGGVFRFEWEVVGKRVGPLGGMDNPIYFNYGIAMHGAANVPLEPASHGCIRMHKRISETFQSYVHLKDLVYVWGEDGRNPEDYSPEEMKPVFNRRDPTATTTTTTTVAPTTTTTVPPTTTTTATTVPAATTTSSEPPAAPASTG
jgi:peptidoglycan hydrolase-like protein with peptidoglycan-binding domain